MLNQEKIGKYIAEKRKELGITQKQLADRVGLTDKAVSKWERGKSIPDHAVITDLCKALDISVNEFLSGEDIVEEAYLDKAEENMMALIEDKKSQMRKSKIIIVSLSIGFLFVMLGLYALTLNLHGVVGVTRFIDLPPFLFVIGITVIISATAGTINDFLEAFRIVDGQTHTQIEKSLQAVELAMLMNLMGGSIYFVGQMILNIPQAIDMEQCFGMVSVSLLSVWYGLLLDIFLTPIYFKCKRKNSR